MKEAGRWVERAGQFNFFKLFPNFSNLVLTNSSENVRNVFQIALKWIFFLKNHKIAPRPSLWYIWAKLMLLRLSNKKMFNLFEPFYWSSASTWVLSPTFASVDATSTFVFTVWERCKRFVNSAWPIWRLYRRTHASGTVGWPAECGRASRWEKRDLCRGR